MGYRSQIIIAFKPEVEVPPAIYDMLTSTFAEMHHDIDGKLFYDSDLKWYEDDPAFPHVDAIMKYLRDLEDEDEELFFYANLDKDSESIDSMGEWREGFEINVITNIEFEAPAKMRHGHLGFNGATLGVLDSVGHEYQSALATCVENISLDNTPGRTSAQKLVTQLREMAGELQNIADSVVNANQG